MSPSSPLSASAAANRRQTSYADILKSSPRQILPVVPAAQMSKGTDEHQLPMGELAFPPLPKVAMPSTTKQSGAHTTKLTAADFTTTVKKARSSADTKAHSAKVSIIDAIKKQPMASTKPSSFGSASKVVTTSSGSSAQASCSSSVAGADPATSRPDSALQWTMKKQARDSMQLGLKDS